ncbi:uncharacterized protein LACBIDRAFT_334615 [Laccaria bicolor S238N-H82]|uniref:Predicted protein n=1 Tax=Laccaria bicolor (strain S238N-H82 / ATCC MYA-4686) TaxID=486041 RepID=B0DZQ9_LACBS|nr:uncharacterized protein LACBIDRAFT_334615 [Laccaria bicolor S238N-H82]EDQ99875.1 predicted protein [Laccaria bicolor S238N-H82]|eukprot:XP_001889418.1 predicted protein [Laccaria bicolor S238N-H82]
MSLPLELVREIIDLRLFSAPPHSWTPEDPGCSTKPRWGTIHALSLTSKSYRALVLEAWFRTLYVKSPQNLVFLQKSFPELGKHLDLRRATWFDLGAIQGIADTPGFGHLKTLKMVQSRMWCEICQACCMVGFKDRPTSLVHEGGLGLPILYARVLAPLECLEEVVIMITNNGFGWTTLNVNPNLWSGECDACMMMMCDNDAFREKWVARKKRVGLASGDGGNDDGQKDVFRILKTPSKQPSRLPTLLQTGQGCGESPWDPPGCAFQSA